MKLTLVASFYDSYLKGFPPTPRPTAGSYFRARVDHLLDDAFGMGHMVSPEMASLGWDATTIICNDRVSQNAWCEENGIAPDSLPPREVLVRQLETIRPDVLYLLDPITYDSAFLRSLSFRPHLVLGWRSAPIPPSADFSGFDLMLTSAEACRRALREQGCPRVEWHYPGFRRKVWEACRDEPRVWDLVFCGQWSRDHLARNKLLLDLAKAPLLGRGEFSLGYFLAKDPALPVPLGVAMHDHGPRWGLAMFRALRSGRTSLHLPIDLADANAAAMRIFESTGLGVPLFVNDDPNMASFFRPDEEVVVYRSVDELAEKLVHLIAHPAALDRIGRAGQERCLRDHSMEARARRLDEIVRSAWPESAPRKASVPAGEDVSMGERFPEVTFGDGVQIVGLAGTRIGAGSVVGDGVWINDCVRDGELRVDVGRVVCVGRWSVLTAAVRVEIGDHTVLAPNVIVNDTGHVFRDPYRPYTLQGLERRGALVIEENCHLGQGVAVFGAVRIGRGSVVLPRATVVDDVEPWSVVAGSPARVVQMYDPVALAWVPVSSEDERRTVMENRARRPMPDRETYRQMLRGSGLERLDPIIAGGGRHV